MVNLTIQKLPKKSHTNLQKHTLIQQAVLLGRHDEVMCVVLVVDDVLQVYAGLLVQVLEELLVEYECYAADLWHLLEILCVVQS